MRKAFFVVTLLCIILTFGVGAFAAEEVSLSETDDVLLEMKELYYRSYFSEICDGLDTASASNATYDNTFCVKVVPNPASENGYINLDGYIFQTANIDVSEYATVVVMYKYISDSPVKGKAELRLMPSDIFSKATFMTSREDIVANRWAVMSFDLSLARSTIKPGVNPILKQLHLLPFGTTDVKEMSSNDTLYVSKMYVIPNKSYGASYRSHYIEGSYAEDGTLLFKPSDYLTCAEACTMIARLIADGDKYVPAGDGKTRFNDISGHSLCKYIEYCEDVGFLKSFDNEFLPDEYISQSHFAEMVYFLGLYSELGPQAYSEITDAVKNPIADIPQSTKPISRAEAVILINGVYGRNPGDAFEQFKGRFADVTEGHYARNQILDAAFDHLTLIDENGEEYWIRGLGNANAVENFLPDYDAGNAKYNEISTLMTERIEEIRNTPNTEFDISGKTYYVSTYGDDDNDGLSETTPLRTASRASQLAVSGDLVLFERGCEWRECWTTQSGVTYSAYGYGAKPVFNGNTRGDAADSSLWTLVEGTTSVYKYAYKVMDVGNIVLDGTSSATKYMPTLSGSNHMLNGKVFDPKTSMTSNNHFICIYDGVKDGYVDVNTAYSTLYLRCDGGNPGDYYDSIEICEKGHIVSVRSNSRLDNICIRYVGSHGFSMGSVNNVSFTNCEIGWIGGSAQYYNNGSMVRFGNGIEIYGSCDGYLVDNCYVYQCYDAGVTHQHSNGGTTDIIEKNVSYTNNVIDKCIYNIEYFLGTSEDGTKERYMENILIKGNILARSGGGWGYSPSRSASIVGWGHHRNEAKNFVIEDNIFFADNYNCFFIAAEKEEWLPIFRNNTYIRRYNTDFAKYGLVNQYTQYKFMGNTDDILTIIMKEENPTLYYYK